eukprot:gene13749-15186_t
MRKSLPESNDANDASLRRLSGKSNENGVNKNGNFPFTMKETPLTQVIGSSLAQVDVPPKQNAKWLRIQDKEATGIEIPEPYGAHTKSRYML